MIYAGAHDQNVADDYFVAMERIEQRLAIGEEKKNENVKVQTITCTSEKRAKLLEFADQLAQPDLCQEERLSVVSQLLILFSVL